MQLIKIILDYYYSNNIYNTYQHIIDSYNQKTRKQEYTRVATWLFLIDFQAKTDKLEDLIDIDRTSFEDLADEGEFPELNYKSENIAHDFRKCITSLFFSKLKDKKLNIAINFCWFNDNPVLYNSDDIKIDKYNYAKYTYSTEIIKNEIYLYDIIDLINIGRHKKCPTNKTLHVQGDGQYLDVLFTRYSDEIIIDLWLE